MQKSHWILVVEDDISLAQAIKLRLETQGIAHKATRSGKEALEIISKNSTNLPGVIWLDFDVLDMDGLEVIRSIAKHPEWKDIAIVIVSNTGDPERINEALELGADKYIVKAEETLDNTVKQVLHYVKG